MKNIKKGKKNPNNTSSPIYSPTSNSNNILSSNKIQNGQSTQLKRGQVFLTPLEGMIINKRMPYGFKFEVEENIPNLQKHFDLIITQNKKETSKLEINDNKKNETKNNQIDNNNIINKQQNQVLNKTNSKKIKNKKEKESSKDSLNKTINSNSQTSKIIMKCSACFQKIKSNQNSNFFYLSNSPDIPCLADLEKKIKNSEYKSLEDFIDDTRKLWNSMFKIHAKEPSIYQSICKMSSYTEQAYKEIMNDKQVENAKVEKEQNLYSKKKSEKIKKTMEDSKINMEIPYPKITQYKSQEEINNLGQLIRTLNKVQLKGIIPLIKEEEEKDSKLFEFDLEQLTLDKYTKLENYVNKCKSINENTIYKSLKLENDKNKNEQNIRGINNNSTDNLNNHKMINNLNKDNKNMKNNSSDSDSMSVE